MKTKIVGLMAVMMALMVAAPAMALTQINTQLSTNGYTLVKELTTVAGYDWTEKSMQVTAYVLETVENEGDLYMAKTINNPGQWELQESKYMQGSGDTTIAKEVVWWTEDSKTINGGQTMMYPTIAEVYVKFNSFDSYGNVMSDKIQVYNVADDPVEGPAGEFSHGYVARSWDTNDDFTYNEGVSFGMPLNCDRVAPIAPSVPECISIGCR